LPGLVGLVDPNIGATAVLVAATLTNHHRISSVGSNPQVGTNDPKARLLKVYTVNVINVIWIE
jgi:hypothetical protein